MPRKNKLLCFCFSLILGLVGFFVVSSPAQAAIDYSCGNGATAKSFSGNTGYCTNATINAKKYNIYCGVPMLADESINIKQSLGNEYYKTDAQGNIILMSDAVTKLENPSISSDSKIIIGKNQTIILSKANSNISGEIFPNYNLNTILTSGSYTAQPNKFFLIKKNDGTNIVVFDADGIYAANSKGNAYAKGIFLKDRLIITGSGTTGSQIVKTNNDVIAISPAAYDIAQTIDLNNYFSNANNTYPLLCRAENYGAAKVFKLEKQCYDGITVYNNNELSSNSCKQCQPTTPENIKAGLINLAKGAACDKWCSDGSFCNSSNKCANGSDCQASGKCDGSGNCYDCTDEADTGICQKCSANHTKYYVASGADTDGDCSAGSSCDGSGNCKLNNNQTCTSDAVCRSGDCNAKPDGTWVCADNTSSCVYADNSSASSPNDKTCYATDKYTCTEESIYNTTNGWTKTDCNTDCGLYDNVHNCTGTSCQLCPTSCSDDSECKDGSHCDGTCVANQANGGGCDEDTDCASNACRPGLTGAFACVPDSTKCSYYDGGNNTYKSNADKVCYDNDVYKCGQTTASYWGQNEDCNKICGLYADVNSCSAGACTQCKTDTTGCTGDGDCKTNAYCNNDATRRCVVRIADGGSCTADNQCASGSSCKIDLSNGTKKCEPATSCLSGGTATTNAGKICFSGDSYTCNSGTWGTTECGVYICSNTVCATSCTADSSCVSGYHCDGAACVINVADGGTCTVNNQCSSSHCNNGYCCANGVCCSAAANCNDSNTCTTDTCSSNICSNTNATYSSACDDGNECTGVNDFCSGSTCSPGAILNCTAGNCTACNGGAGYCASGSCTPELTNGSTCVDNTQCSSGNACATNLSTGAKKCEPATKCIIGGTDVVMDNGTKVCYSADSYTCNSGTWGSQTDCSLDCGLYPNQDSCSNTTGVCTSVCATSCTNTTNDCKQDAHCVSEGSGIPAQCRSGQDTLCVNNNDCDQGYACTTNQADGKKYCLANSNAPKVTSFGVTPTTSSGAFTITYGGLTGDSVQLWRQQNGGDWLGLCDTGQWKINGCTYLSIPDSYADTPSETGTYTYGLHIIKVVSGTTYVGTETTSGLSPISVTKVQCTASADCNDNNDCTSPDTCTSNTCSTTNLNCTSSANCPICPNGYCSTGVCAAKLASGTACVADNQCTTGLVCGPVIVTTYTYRYNSTYSSSYGYPSCSICDTSNATVNCATPPLSSASTFNFSVTPPWSGGLCYDRAGSSYNFFTQYGVSQTNLYQCRTPITYYRDADGDSYGNASVTIQAGSAPTGYITNSTDCNDANASITNCSASGNECKNSPGTCSSGACSYTNKAAGTACSSGKCYSGVCDTTAPTGAIAVSSANITSNTSVNITVSSIADIGSGVSRVEIWRKINSGAWIQYSNDTYTSGNIIKTDTPIGSVGDIYYYGFHIVDNAGNVGTESAAATVTIVQCTAASQCDDGKICTADTCSSYACSNVNLASGASCGANLVCNGAGSCVSACTPICSGKVCLTDNGCGGTCAVGSGCVDGFAGVSCWYDDGGNGIDYYAGGRVVNGIYSTSVSQSSDYDGTCSTGWVSGDYASCLYAQGKVDSQGVLLNQNWYPQVGDCSNKRGLWQTCSCLNKFCGSADECGKICAVGSGCTACSPVCNSSKYCGVAGSDGCGGTCAVGSGCTIQITNCTELQNMKNNLAASYELANNIDCSDTINWNMVSGIKRGFKPIGGSTPFTGKFNGNYKVINNLYIYYPEYPGENYGSAGLFGAASAAEIKNVGLTNVTVVSQVYAGGLASGIGNSTNVSNSYAIGYVYGESGAGGLIAISYSSNINNSYSSGSVYGGTAFAGGLIADFNEGSKIYNSYSASSVSGNSYKGGLVGAISGFGSPSYVYNSYSIGSVSGSSYGIGGLVGGFGGGYISNSYWNTQTSGQSVGCGLSSCAGATGKTSMQMIDSSQYSGWDFTSIWKMYSSFGNGTQCYPLLFWQPDSCIPSGIEFEPSRAGYGDAPHPGGLEYGLHAENGTAIARCTLSSGGAYGGPYTNLIAWQPETSPTTDMLSTYLGGWWHSTAAPGYYRMKFIQCGSNICAANANTACNNDNCGAGTYDCSGTTCNITGNAANYSSCDSGNGYCLNGSCYYSSGD